MNKQRKFILIAAVIGIISTFLPWISVSAGAFGYSVSQSRNGFNGIGILYFMLLIAMAAVAAIGNQQETLQKNMRLAVIGGGAFSLICLLIAYNHGNNQTSGGYGLVEASIGYGFILAFVASLSVTLIPVFIKQDGESFQNDLAQLKTSVKSLQSNIATAAATTSNSAKSAPSGPKNENRMAEIEKLIEWRNDGKITTEEYEDLKSKIM